MFPELENCISIRLPNETLNWRMFFWETLFLHQGRLSIQTLQCIVYTNWLVDFRIGECFFRGNPFPIPRPFVHPDFALHRLYKLASGF